MPRIDIRGSGTYSLDAPGVAAVSDRRIDDEKHSFDVDAGPVDFSADGSVALQYIS